MTENNTRIRISLITAVALGGCTHSMELETPTLHDAAVPWVDQAQYVTLLNGSTNRNEKVCSNLVHKWTVNEYELTESLISALTPVLKNSNIHVQEKAPKRLMLALTAACNLASGDAAILIMARTGDGQKKNVGDTSWAPMVWQVEGAYEKSLANSARALLADKDIMAYLSK